MMSWKKDVKGRFSLNKDANKWNDIYKRDNPSIEDSNFRQRRDYTIDYVKNHFPCSAKILDLGCGAGPTLKELCSAGYNCTGIDYSLDMLNFARNHLGENLMQTTTLIQADSECLPYKSESIDCIVCLGMISYVKNVGNALKEMHRILTDDGVVILSFRNKYNPCFSDPIA